MLKNLFILKNKFSVLISIFILLLVSLIIFYKAVNYKTVMVEDLLFSSKYYEHFQDKDIIKKIFTTSVYFDRVKYLYRPIFILSFYIDSKISSGKVNLKVNHTTSLLLHLVCVLIFFYFLIDYCNFKLYLALIGSLIFSINIFSVWSAVWLSGRCDLLLFLFAFSSFIFFIKSNETGIVSKRILYFILHIFLFFLALLSKETAVVLPIICLIFSHTKGYKLKSIYLCYILIYVLYYSMYSNDVNLVKQFVWLFDIKNFFYITCDYISTPFCFASVKVVSPYNNLTMLKGIGIITSFIIMVIYSKEKKLILFYALFALLFFLPTFLGKRLTFQGNRMYLPMAGLIISILYITEDFCKKNNLINKICIIVLLIFMSINIINTHNTMKFAYDDDSIIKVICEEYKNDLRNRREITSLMFFLVDHYKMYGFNKFANNIKYKFSKFQFSTKDIT